MVVLLVTFGITKGWLINDNCTSFIELYCINYPDLYKDDSFDIIVLKDMYSFSDIITGGLIGSILALGIRYLLERWSASTAYKRELRKQVFQRKTDAVERAMSWYQEAFDMYSLYQIAISEYDGSLNPVTLTKLQYVSVQMIKLLQETSVKLNPITMILRILT